MLHAAPNAGFVLVMQILQVSGRIAGWQVGSVLSELTLPLEPRVESLPLLALVGER